MAALSTDYSPEFNFRIRRARAIYPNYISDSMVNRWCDPGFDDSLVADVSFIRAAPNFRSSSSSDHGGLSSSFSGGSSSGGGGAGGSW